MTTGPARTDVGARPSMKNAIAESLKAEIVSGELAPGTKLSEARLAERFGTSRMPVREAFQMLARSDFVIIEQRRGTFVRGVSQRQMVDLYEVREALEGMAARLCATRATSALLTELDELIAEMAETARQGDAQGYIAKDERLHELVFQGAANERLLDHYGLLIDHLHRNYLSAVVTRREGRLDRSLAEHRGVVEAIRMRDGDLAEEAMRTHVRQGRLELAQQMIQTKLGT